MSSPQLRSAIADLLRQVGAPEWAAPNLDALADVLRDLSWQPAGEVSVNVGRWPDLPVEDLDALLGVLRRSVAETADSPRPVRLEVPPAHLG